MNKIRAIEMHLAGFGMFDIAHVLNMCLIDLGELIVRYEKEKCVTVESKMNKILKNPHLSHKVRLRDMVFDSKTEFADYLYKTYGHKKNRTMSRLKNGATPEECLLNQVAYLRRNEEY